LAAILRAAGAGQPKPVYLFAGEPFATAAAAQQLLAVLVPPERRSFNLETYDGRTTPVATVLDSLRTPGFFAGTKVVWLRECTLLLSAEKRSEVTQALFAAWSEGREQEAAEKLLTLAALAGWSKDEFQATRYTSLSKTRAREVFGEELDVEQLATLDAVRAAATARGLTVQAYRDESGALLDFLEAEAAPNAVLVLTASAVDARKRLFKQLRELGAVLDLSAARERSGALSRETVDEVIQQVLRAFGKHLAPPAHQEIVKRAGHDLGMLTAEMEKVCLYAGERGSITIDDVRAVFRDMAESWIFDFTGALATRQLAVALPLLRGLLQQGEPVLRLLAMVVRELRLLLVARDALDTTLRGTWRSDISFTVFQNRVLPHVDDETRQAFGNTHPFVLYRRLQDAARIDARVLRDALQRLAALDVRLKSSRSDPALLLEAFVVQWCRGPAPSRRTIVTPTTAPRRADERPA